MIEKINIEKLGEFITEWKDGKPFTSQYNNTKACDELAKKLNEIIDFINPKE